MNAPEKSMPPPPSASDYILDNFKPTDRIAVLVLNRQLGETTQRITTAQKASGPNSKHGSGTRTQMEPISMWE